jgi:hypothetical protein
VTPTVNHLAYGPLLRAVNGLAGMGEWAGTSLGRLDVDGILAEARRQTGLSDWGDERFLTNLRHVVDCVLAKEGFTPLARIILRQSFVRAVCNRLWLQAWLRSHPAVLERRVERPIFVLGFPRTGTTVLQNLLAAHPDRRGLPFWQLTVPVPMAASLDEDTRLRRRTAAWMLFLAYRAAPEMAEVHYVDTDTLEECWPLFANSFAVMNWELQSGLEAWGDWVQGHADMVQAYREYRTYLQVALDRQPTGQLVLKCPEHLWFLDSLLEVFPDACVIWTHRDPYETLGSYCSLMSLQWRTLYGAIDRPALGAFMERRLLVGIDRALAVRDRRGSGSFFDARFVDTVRDPIAVVEQASAHFGLENTPAHRDAMAAYLRNKRADERGRHRYDPADYGLDADRVRARYAHYVSRFGLAPSPAAEGRR